MTELFDRYYELQINDVVITIDDLDIEFTVENDTKNNAGSAEIIIYNLSKKTNQKIVKDAKIMLKAGYRDDYGTIFYGRVDKVWDEKEKSDVRTIIHALDETKALFTHGYFNRAYPKGTPIINVVRDVLSQAGIPPAKLVDPQIKLKKTTTFTGRFKDVLDECVNIVNGELIKQGVAVDRLFTYYIKNGMGYFVRTDFKDVEAIVLSSETGLMEVMREEDEESTIDYRIRCLLLWKAVQDAIIKLESFTVSGVFKVVEFKHVCKYDEFYSELGVKAV